jgi:hypothetical protein
MQKASAATLVVVVTVIAGIFAAGCCFFELAAEAHRLLRKI